MQHQYQRRRFLSRLLLGASTAVLTGCDKLSHSEWFANVLTTGESLTKNTHHLIRTR